MHHTIVSGSKEYVLVNVGDRLEDVTDLTPLTPTFTVYDKEDTPMQVDVPADVDADDNLIAKCLVDTATPTPWASNEYRLFLTLHASPEQPVLGPVPFMVEEV